MTAKPLEEISMHGFNPKPLTEGYQPQSQKGYQPQLSGAEVVQSSSPAHPPSGGSSAMPAKEATKK
jgi:hypothetical protein